MSTTRLEAFSDAVIAIIITKGKLSILFLRGGPGRTLISTGPDAAGPIGGILFPRR